MDESKHEIHSQVDAITAGTASVVNLTAGTWLWDDSGNDMLFNGRAEYSSAVEVTVKRF